MGENLSIAYLKLELEYYHLRDEISVFLSMDFINFKIFWRLTGEGLRVGATLPNIDAASLGVSPDGLRWIQAVGSFSPLA